MTLDSYPTLLQAGNALVAQAQTVATQDFAAARALWREAGALFLRAHQADPLQHAAALRLAQASMAEAHALQKEESEDAVAMWRRAAAQCEAAFELDPHHAATAKLAASAYAWAQDPEAAQGWAQIARHLSEQPAAEGAHEGDQPQTAAD